MSNNAASSAEWNINWHTYGGVRIGFEITTSPHGSTLPVCETRHFRPGWRESWTPEELERHANLISAAPGLLAAAKWLIDFAADNGIECENGGIQKLQQARHAVAKAEGQA